jgi:hypothetical protein
MENTSAATQEAANQYYYLAVSLFNEGKSGYETKNALIENGLSSDAASLIVEKIETQIHEAQQEHAHAQAKKDMIYGALWCVGGTILTLSHIGFIFWGAILFGGIQFFRGLINLNS